MPLHTQVDVSHQDAEIAVNPIYFRELSCEIPRYRLAATACSRAPRFRSSTTS